MISTTVNSVFSALKTTSYRVCPLHRRMKIKIVSTQAVTARVTIRTSFAITFIIYASPESGTPGILIIAVIAVTALWKLQQKKDESTTSSRERRPWRPRVWCVEDLQGHSNPKWAEKRNLNLFIEPNPPQRRNQYF